MESLFLFLLFFFLSQVQLTKGARHHLATSQLKLTQSPLRLLSNYQVRKRHISFFSSRVCDSFSFLCIASRTIDTGCENIGSDERARNVREKNRAGKEKEKTQLEEERFLSFSPSSLSSSSLFCLFPRSFSVLKDLSPLCLTFSSRLLS
jgi:hypothetical protein